MGKKLSCNVPSPSKVALKLSPSSSNLHRSIVSHLIHCHWQIFVVLTHLYLTHGINHLFIVLDGQNLLTIHSFINLYYQLWKCEATTFTSTKTGPSLSLG